MFSEKNVEEIEQMLRTDRNWGLSEEEARKRLSEYGRNELPDDTGKSFLLRLLSQFMDPLIYVLLAAGVISLFLGETADAGIIFAVVVLNAAVGFVQEGKAQKALDALKKMTRLHAIVRRGGIDQEIDAAELVCGDVVILDTGRQIPADLRLTLTENMRMEESALTGESVPVYKDADFITAAKTSVGDQKNMAFMSANVTAGRGEGIVVRTGAETEIGKIAKMIHETPEETTPLQKRLGDLGTCLSFLAIGLCLLLFGAAVWQKRDAAEMFITAISLAVAAVPEGLPAVVTIVLALSVSRMVKVNTIVRKLPSVETLGAVNIVCSDKTGTLTRNKMTVEKMISSGKMLHQTGNDEELIRALCLCNDAEITSAGKLGDPTELALLEYGEKRAKKPEKWKSEDFLKLYPRIAENAFDSERKMMTTVHRGPSGIVSYTKGAPDILIERCDRYLSGDSIKRFSTAQKKAVLEEVSRLSQKAFRVLAAARTDKDGREEKNMIFLGIAAMEDPPRPEVPHAIELFQRAHVRTVMITGDHKSTAFAIARKLGIASDESQCMSGEELDRINEDELRERLLNVSVFARVSSNHKVQIVRALKADGNIVAMTGDGVNDAPSLKAADVGIAMGQGGTDVAKQAADIILTDDNFATIEKAIEEGRGIYRNIKKSVIFLLSSNFGEIMTMFTAILLSLPSPLKASHILWINLITDSLPALALGTDQNDGEALMEECPRGLSESLFSRGGGICTVFYGILIAIISLLAFLRIPISLLSNANIPINASNLAIILEKQEILSRSQTYAFTVLGLSELFHAVGMRDVNRSVFQMNHKENKLMIIAFVLGIVLQVSVTEMPCLVSMFQTAALSGSEWMELLVLAAMPLAAHEGFVFLNWTGEAVNNRCKKW